MNRIARILVFYGLVTLCYAVDVSAALEDSMSEIEFTQDAGNHAEGLAESIANSLTHGRHLSQATRPPAWRGRFDPTYQRSYMAPAMTENKCDTSQNCSMLPGDSYPYEKYILNPTGIGPASQPVLKIGYPKGSWSPGSPKPGGTLFYPYPFKSDPNEGGNPLSSVGAALEYEVYMPADFPWVKGGKLPGMSGGASNGKGCGGGVNPHNCFSFRLMWRREGAGEAYLYIPEGMQAPDFCSYYPPCGNGVWTKCTECNFKAGVSFGRGNFFFTQGEWTKVRLEMTLNSVNKTDGTIKVIANGVTAISYNKINWRQYSNVKIEGIQVASWFGGSDDTWSPPYDTHVLIRNFRAWRFDPVAGTATATATSTNTLTTSTTTNMRPGTGRVTSDPKPTTKPELPFTASAAVQGFRREVIKEGN